MAVVRLNAGQCCWVCGSVTDLPHANTADCARALDSELQDLLRRRKELLSRRHAEIAQRAKNLQQNRLAPNRREPA